MITKKDIGRRVSVTGECDNEIFDNELGIIVSATGVTFWVGVMFDKRRDVFHSCQGACEDERGFFVKEDIITFIDAVEDDHNNGGSTDYYKINLNWKECQDIIENRNMNFAQGNIFKVAFCFNQGRHEAANYKRELNKIKWFADRELNRIKGKRNEKTNYNSGNFVGC